MEEFKTIVGESQAEIVEKKSRFIANLINVNSVKEAEDKIREVKKKYFDARHNCIAYRVIEDDSIKEKSSDDGEPSGTAGAPMLSILQKNELLNVVVVVTRYFGGTLLGTGGLVRAYSGALLDAISNSEIVDKCLGEELEVVLDYSNNEIFKYYCKNNNINIINSEYGENVKYILECEIDKSEKLFSDYENMKVNLKSCFKKCKKIITKCK